MKPLPFSSLNCQAQVERWPLAAPFRTTGFVRSVVDVVVVTLERDGVAGRGEATGVRYRGETGDSMLRQIEACKPLMQSGIDRSSLRTALPSGGARNAIDCALWDLEAKTTGVPAWQRAGLGKPNPLVTILTCGADTPERMAANALHYVGAKAIKLKLTGESMDADRVRAVREARPDVWLSVDANQGLTRRTLELLMPTLVESGVAIIEQPLPVGQEAQLDGFCSPIPLGADESIQNLAGIPALAGRFAVVNIKLDKCGGLTEGLEMARAASEHGLKKWVGNTIGTSLAMAPAFLLGQICDYVELDGPIFLDSDRPGRMEYAAGSVTFPGALWGQAETLA